MLLNDRANNCVNLKLNVIYVVLRRYVVYGSTVSNTDVSNVNVYGIHGCNQCSCHTL